MNRALVPAAASTMTTLSVAIALLSLVATLALAGVLLVNKAASGWRSAVGTEFTVQLRPAAAGDNLEPQLTAVAEAARAVPGIRSARVLSVEETKELLKPWIGSSAMLDELPMPRLVALAIDPVTPPDVDRLTAAITAAAPGAILDTHRQWQGEIVRLAELLQWLGNGIIVVILAASALLVGSTARTAIDGTRQTIEVLYLAGASDGFIVKTVEGRLIAVALRAAAIGLAAALAILLLLAAADSLGFDHRIPEAVRTLGFGDTLTALGFLARLALAPAAIVLVTIATAHLAIQRILRQLF